MRTETSVPGADGVETTHIRLRSPLPPDFPSHPAGCAELTYLRYRPAGGGASADSDALIVAQPGAWLSAGSLDILARNTIRAAARRGVNVEWWSLARRSAGANDRTGIRAALATGDPETARAYYHEGSAIDGRQFQPRADLRYLAEFGLAQAVLDTREVITRELGDPADYRGKLFLCGHAMGGPVVGAYAAWDFDGVGGHTGCAGVIGLDTLLATNAFGAVGGRLAGLVARGQSGAVALLRRGLLPRRPSFLGITHPRVLETLPIVALHAHLRGDAETDLHRHLPRGLGWELAMRALVARGPRDMLRRSTSLRHQRLTGAALLGMMIGAATLPIDGFKVSLGALDGPTTTRRPAPVARWFRRLPGIRLLAQALLGSSATVVPAGVGDLHRWDSNGSVDAEEFARVVVGEPGGFADAHFPVRLALDAAMMLAGSRADEFAALKHEEAAQSLPRLDLLAGEDHVIPVLLHAAGIVPPQAQHLRGYTHIDVVMAAENASGDEPVSAAIAGFVADAVIRPARVPDSCL